MSLKGKNNSELKVAIIGGGFGGAAAAVALRSVGIKADLYEQAPVIGEVGAGIGMRPPTVEFFKDWGIYDAMVSKSSVSEYMEVVTGKGEVVFRERWPQLTDEPNARWSRLIHRADFIGTFLEHLPTESIHLDHKCKSVIDYGDYAVVQFEGDKTIEADLVIAADGIRSNIRSKFFSDAEPVYSGTHAYRAVIDKEDSFDIAPDNTFRVWVEGDVNVYVLPLHHRNQISFDVTVPSDDSSWAPEVETKDIVKHLTNFDPRIQKVAERINDYTCRALYDIDPVERWTSNSIALLGDAAHAMLHHQGQGANQAIQDAGALAEALRDADTIPQALQRYQARRKPVTDKYQELSRLNPSEENQTAFPEKETFERVAE
ncbi:FAD-dependent oxidoreductase [Virgibacillus sediminis]|uniref:FAD-dependent oxidoreductase n=1 Tax=Virgibacillus sediminis TaxID=202260 RepID=A0ABV7A3T6_9BACI